MSERGSEPSSASHLTESAVEQLADELLKGREREMAEAHVESCVACAARLEASRALIEALSALPRFAPSPSFSDEVMANIRISPRASPVLTAGSVVEWTVLQGRSLAMEIGSTATRWGMQVGLPQWAEGIFELLQGVPLDALIFMLIFLAVAIPLSAWSIVRLVRTPTGNVTYAN